MDNKGYSSLEIAESLHAALDASPVLRLVRQESLSSEHISVKNGVQKQVHVVVKNLMFPIEICSTLDITKCHLDAKLYYDFDREEDNKSEVSFVKNEPMEFKVNILDAFRAVFEIKIKVLTSQHEDMLFRIRMSAFDATTSQEYYVYSQPIKVVSKITPQIKRRESKEQILTPQFTKTVKRTASDMLAATLEKLEKQQDDHSKILALIQRKLFPEMDTENGSTNEMEHLQLLEEGKVKPADSNTNHPLTHSQQINNYDHMDLESAFRNFMTVLNGIQPEERQEKVDSFIHQLTSADFDKLHEFVHTLDNRKKLKVSPEANQYQQKQASIQ